MPNSRKGIEYLKNHPEARADDLKRAFLDPTIKIIWTAIGGDDTFRTLPYLMNGEFQDIVRNNPKIFLGMSDTTNNHLMLYRMGLATLYGSAILSDIAELGPEIHDYTKAWLQKMFSDEKNMVIKSSPVWYGGRDSFGPDQLGVPRPIHDETHGHEYLYGNGTVKGDLLGGCLDSLYEMLRFGRYDDQSKIFTSYPIFPTKDEWANKIVFLETSEECPDPVKFTRMLESIEEWGVFDVTRALVFGKPMGEKYYDEYREILRGLAEKHNLPTVYNLNFGHITPRLVLPYGEPMLIDFDKHIVSLPNGLGLK